MDFKIEKRIIKVEKDLIVGDNADYVAHFAFDKEWDGVTKTARFIQNGNYVDVLLEGDKCNIPIEVLKRGYVTVGVYSATMTTSQVDFIVKESIKEKQGNVAEPTPNVYEQLTGKLDDIQAQLPTEVQTYFNEHKDELKGDKGDRGEQGIQGIQGEKGDAAVRGVDYWTAEDQAQVVEDVLTSEEVTGAINTANKASVMAKNTFNSYANALKGAASGEVARVDDVSPVEHSAKVRVAGKNLLNIDILLNENFINNGNGYRLIRADNKRFSAVGNINIRANTKYTLSASSIEGTASQFYLQFYMTDGTTKSYAISPTKLYANMIFTSDVHQTRLYISNEENNDCYMGFTGLQIEEGDTATEYTPYIEPTSVTVTRCGKNLWNKDWASDLTKWQHSNRQPSYYEMPIKVGKGRAVTLSYTKVLDVGLGFYVGIADDIDSSADKWLYHSTVESLINNSISLIAKQDVIYLRVSMASVESGSFAEYVANDLQIELNESKTDYETYKGATYTPNTDGTLNIDSIAPTMTLLTDKDGVNIELEYNKDLNVVINDILSRLNQ